MALNKHVNPLLCKFPFALKSLDAWGHINGQRIERITMCGADWHVNKRGNRAYFFY